MKIIWNTLCTHSLTPAVYFLVRSRDIELFFLSFSFFFFLSVGQGTGIFSISLKRKKFIYAPETKMMMMMMMMTAAKYNAWVHTHTNITSHHTNIYYVINCPVSFRFSIYSVGFKQFRFIITNELMLKLSII